MDSGEFTSHGVDDHVCNFYNCCIHTFIQHTSLQNSGAINQTEVIAYPSFLITYHQ